LIFRDPVPLMMGLAALPFATVIWAVASERQLNPEGRFTAFLLLLGNASYVLYLAHLPILEIFHRTGHLITNLDVLIAIFTTVGFSVVFYLAIDGPVHVAGSKLLKRLSNRPRPVDLA
jgi:exopolysaccharide production protein ExoZ